MSRKDTPDRDHRHEDEIDEQEGDDPSALHGGSIALFLFSFCITISTWAGYLVSNHCPTVPATIEHIILPIAKCLYGIMFTDIKFSHLFRSSCGWLWVGLEKCFCKLWWCDTS